MMPSLGMMFYEVPCSQLQLPFTSRLTLYLSTRGCRGGKAYELGN